MNPEHFIIYQHSFKLHKKRLIEIKGEIGDHKSTDQVVRR